MRTVGLHEREGAVAHDAAPVPGGVAGIAQSRAPHEA